MGRPAGVKNKPRAESILPEDDGQDRAGTEVAIFQPARLPYHPAIEERFGVDKGQWKVLVEAIYPAAKSIDSVVMALSYCKSRNLDPFKRPVHIVPMWDSAKGGYVETIWPGISELRTTASRTKGYAGCDEATFGPEIEFEFKGRVKRDGAWKDEKITVQFPEWCRITVYRIVNGERCKFVGPKVSWMETYASQGASDLPNKMWQERPEGQIEKCAEAGALRRAFPEEIGNELTAEEMIGRNVHDLNVDIPITEIAGNKDSGPPRAASSAPIEQPPTDEQARDGTPPRRTAPKNDPISSGPPRTDPLHDGRNPNHGRVGGLRVPDTGPSDPGPQPHKIPGSGETYESWGEKYCDMLKTSPDIATLYKWIDANSEPLGRLHKGRPSVAASVKKVTENTLQALKDAKEKADAKAAKKAAPATDMDEAAPIDPEQILAQIDSELAAVEDADQLQVVWDGACESLIAKLSFPPDIDLAQAAFDRHSKRLGGD